MARSKVKLAWIEKRSSRKCAYKNRSAGLLAKVQELSILCGLPAVLIMSFPETDSSTVWPSREEAEELLKRYMSLPLYIRRRKMKDPKSFLEEKVASMQADYAKVLKKINEMEMNDTIDQIERQGKWFGEFSVGKLSDVESFLNDKMDKIKKLIMYRMSNHKRSPHHPISYAGNDSYDKIIGQIGRHPSDSLFGSLKRQKGISSSSTVNLQPKTCFGCDDIPTGNRELLLASNDGPFGAGPSMECASYGMEADIPFNISDYVNCGTVGGINNGGGMELPHWMFGENNVSTSDEGLHPGLFDDDELPFSFTELLQSSPSSPS